jgi:exopolysaccharide biosynthesis polyprenyl glycosylphosphotransferase
MIAVYGTMLFFFTNFYGGYRIGYYKRIDTCYSCALAIMICNAITYLQICLVGRELMSAWPLLVMTLFQTALIWLWATAAHTWYMKLFPPCKTLMVYGMEGPASSLMRKMLSHPEMFSLQEAFDTAVGYEKMCEKALEYDNVILCDLPAKFRNRLLKFCFDNGISTYTTPKLSDILVRGSKEVNLLDTPLLFSSNTGLNLEDRLLKRAVDIALSAIGLFLASPFMLITAIAIKLQDGGTVFFKQERCTIDNKEFNLVKFRSMVMDAEKDGQCRLAMEDDPRITPVGRLLRRTRLDELPQLWNILVGDMSIVGPRPERMMFVEKHSNDIPEFSFRSKVKAGLTGYAQIAGKYNTTAYDKLKMDLTYITTYSMIQDFKIILMTVKVMFMKSSTESFVKDDDAAD